MSERKPTTEGLEVAMAVIEGCLERGEIDQSVYSKTVVEIANDYVSHLFDLEKALVLLNKIPANYFDEEFSVHAEEDPFFFAAAIELVYRLNQFGILDALNGAPLDFAAKTRV